MMRTVFIVNPASGPRSAEKQIADWLQASAFAGSRVVQTTCPGDAAKIARKLCTEAQEELCLMACGGDGTINEVVNGALDCAGAVVGCIPCGSGNDLVKYWGGRDMFMSAEAQANGRAVPIDVIRVNDRCAVNEVNFGYDAVCADRMVRFRRVPLFAGHRSYYPAVVLSLADSMRHRCALRADGEILADGELLLCTLMNGDYLGGSFRCAPRADITDGQMEVCAVKPLSRVRFASMIGDYKTGKYLDDPRFENVITYRRARSAVVDAPGELCLCMDGEIVRGTHFDISVLPGAIRFLLPRGAAHVR